jgi:hypothetical protein
MSRQRGVHSTTRRRAKQVVVDHDHWIEAVARSLRGDCGPLTNALEVEMVASAALASWGDSDQLAETRDPFFRDLIDELERAGDPHALALLRGLEAVATDTIAVPSGAAADRLTADGVPAPACLDGLGTARPAEAWTARSPDSDAQVCVFVEFTYPAARDHTLAVFIDHTLGGIAKHLGCIEALSRIPQEERPDMALEPIAPSEAGALLSAALDATDPLVEREVGNTELVKLGALAWARARALTDPS